MSDYKIYECIVCGWRYDEALGLPEEGIIAGTRFEDIPDDWVCPDCAVGKEDFEMVAISTSSVAAVASTDTPATTATASSAASQEPAAPSAEPDVLGVSQTAETPFELWECIVCGWRYDESLGVPDEGIAPGTRWSDIPEDWVCPECGVGKEDFEMVGISRSITPEALAEQQNPTPVFDDSAEHVVILGSGLAGYNLVRELRKHSKSVRITVITKDNGAFYSKPLLSTGFKNNKTAQDLATHSAEKMVADYQIHVETFTEVTQINTAANMVITERGPIAYDKLVLATGAAPISAPFEGNGGAKVYQVNDLDDYHRFRTATKSAQRVLVIGAGLIGSEYANDLIQSGKSVVTVDPLSGPIASLLPEKASLSVKRALENAGVEYHLETVVERIELDGQGVVATLANGTQIEADVVLSAIGVRPRTDLAAQAGITVNRGIVADRTLKTSIDNVFTLGDCAEVDGHVLYYILPLMDGARALAKTLLGHATQVQYGVMPVVIKTTLCPVVACPPARGAEGQWILSGTVADGVCAEFRNPKGELLGFALTGQATSSRDTLAKQCPSIM